jgi:hypothetical protein
MVPRKGCLLGDAEQSLAVLHDLPKSIGQSKMRQMPKSQLSPAKLLTMFANFCLTACLNSSGRGRMLLTLPPRSFLRER